MIKINDYKPLKFKGEMYVFGLRTTYKNGLCFKYVPYKVISGLTASARLGTNRENLCSNKGLKKIEVFL